MKKGVRRAYRLAVRTARIENTRHYADLALRAQAKDVLIMPTKVEARLREEAEKKFPGNRERQDAYIYGTMRKLGWKPSREKEKKA
jgi:hypothetical protein